MRNDSTRTDEHPYASGMLYLIFAGCVLPIFCIDVLSLIDQWRAFRVDESVDGPQVMYLVMLAIYAGTASLILFLIAMIVSIYIWVSAGSGVHRRRIVIWYGMLVVYIPMMLIGPNGGGYPMRFYMAIYEVAVMLPVLVLPLFWLWQDRRYYFPSLRKSE